MKDEIIQTEKKVTVKVTVNQKKILEIIKYNPQITQEELANVIGLTKCKKSLRKIFDFVAIQRILGIVLYFFLFI